MRKSTIFFIFALALAFAVAQVIISDADGPQDYAKGEVLVKYRAGVSEKSRALKVERVRATRLREYRDLRLSHLQLEPGMSVQDAIAELEADPDVEYAEPNYRRHALPPSVWPDDYNATELWGLAQIQAREAWDIANVCESPVAVIDTGITYGHPDLADNVWQNTGEDCFNGIDDDANGYVDDCQGWDFVGTTYDNPTPDNDPLDGAGHGTHVSGTIGAVGNNVTGVVGVCAAGAQLMALKSMDDSGNGWTSEEIEAIYYAKKMGATVINLSLGGTECSNAEKDAIWSFGSTGGVVVAAAGNSLTDNDINPEYPASHDLPYIISVAATNTLDGLVYFTYPTAPGSNYGFTSVDLGAPGNDIKSTWPPSTYATLEGSSMATPHVAGVVALINSTFPDMNAVQKRAQLLGTVDEVPALAGKVVTGGRLNARNAVLARVPELPNALVANVIAGSTVELTWTDNSDDETNFRIERMDEGGTSFVPIANVAAGATLYQDASVSVEVAAGQGYYYRVRALKAVDTGAEIVEIRSTPSNTVGVNANPSDLLRNFDCRQRGGGGGGGCFIATAAYGSTMMPELDILRGFRDGVLMKSEMGRAVVKFYYRTSPPVAHSIRNIPALRAVMRGVIAPVVFAIDSPAVFAAIVLLAAAFIIAGSRKRGLLK